MNGLGAAVHWGYRLEHNKLGHSDQQRGGKRIADGDEVMMTGRSMTRRQSVPTGSDAVEAMTMATGLNATSGCRKSQTLDGKPMRMINDEEE